MHALGTNGRRHGSQPSELPLAGVLVIALEQAVAAPYCSSRLADAGARVIKVERGAGDVARGCDHTVHGQSSRFLWLNRGKESIALDPMHTHDLALLARMLARADVFIQNLEPGTTEQMGIDSDTLRKRHPRLITCDISGYGDHDRLYAVKASDLLVQAESGLLSASGAPSELQRMGVSVCDISAGMNALVGIQQALLARARSGRGSAVKVSLFDSAAELMSVPYLQARYGSRFPQHVGLGHPALAPHGSFACADGRDIAISIRNEHEWADFCREVLREPALIDDPQCESNAARCANREWVDAKVSEVFGALTSAAVIDRLIAAQTAYGSVNSVHDLIEHPQLRTRKMPVADRLAEIPALPWVSEWDPECFAAAPTLNEHGNAIRAEFGA